MIVAAVEIGSLKNKKRTDDCCVMRHLFICTEQGGALVIVLVISSLLLLSSLWALSTYKQGVAATAGLLAKLEARIAVESTFQELLYYGVTGRFTGSALLNTLPAELGFPVKIPLGGEKKSVSPPGGELRGTFSCQDSSGMLNVLYLNPHTFANVLRHAGATVAEAATMSDSLADWTDGDDLHHINGAEKQYYKLEIGAAYGPRNSPAIQNPWELSLLRGMTLQFMEKLLPGMALSPTGGYNIQTMDALMLQVRFNITAAQAEELIILRNYHGYLNMVNIRDITGRSNYGLATEGAGFTSRLLKVELQARVRDAVERWQVWIDFVPDSSAPYKIVSWQEGLGV